MGAAGLTSAFAGATKALASVKDIAGSSEDSTQTKEQKAKFPQVPRRKLGKTGIDVPCLSFGMLAVDAENQILLRNTLQWGVNYWDTASSYSGGNSELGIGKFLSKNPDVRKKLFLVTKASGARTVAHVEERLATSLKRMNTDYIDLYYVPHGADDPAQFTDELKQWAESAKKRKLIRFFGFSTHSNMAKCLAAAAKLGWIDALMTRYSFRDVQNAEMQAAIDACHKAKIGLVAMKTIGRASRRSGGEGTEADAGKKLREQLLERGFTQEQAAIKLVLQDERISSACVGMLTTAIVTANVAAVLDKTELTEADRQVFKEYAQATCSSYCAGCTHVCKSAVPDVPCVSDIMRYLMYYNSYGDRVAAREMFAQIPATIRGRLLSANYGLAESQCPQHLPIAKLISEAVSKLA